MCFFSHTFILIAIFFLEIFSLFSQHVEAGIESDLFWLISLLEMCKREREYVHFLRFCILLQVKKGCHLLFMHAVIHIECRRYSRQNMFYFV